VRRVARLWGLFVGLGFLSGYAGYLSSADPTLREALIFFGLLVATGLLTWGIYVVLTVGFVELSTRAARALGSRRR